MTNYTIANIPTLYRGRMYRSRLEARWAAFFDRLGWTYEYEPFDLGAWSPDFLLTDLNVLVEVKPLTEFNHETAEKMNGAQDGFHILTRTAPVIEAHFVEIGWMSISYQNAGIAWRVSKDRPELYADIVSFIYDWDKDEATHGVFASDRKLFDLHGKLPQMASYGDYTMRLWADAANAVQWEPKQ